MFEKRKEDVEGGGLLSQWNYCGHEPRDCGVRCWTGTPEERAKTHRVCPSPTNPFHMLHYSGQIPKTKRLIMRFVFVSVSFSGVSKSSGYSNVGTFGNETSEAMHDIGICSGEVVFLFVACVCVVKF